MDQKLRFEVTDLPRLLDLNFGVKKCFIFVASLQPVFFSGSFWFQFLFCETPVEPSQAKESLKARLLNKRRDASNEAKKAPAPELAPWRLSGVLLVTVEEDYI